MDAKDPLDDMAEHITEEKVDHPAHYGGAGNSYEAIKVIEAWKLDFCLGNAIKYIARAGKKSLADEVEDLAVLQNRFAHDRLWLPWRRPTRGERPPFALGMGGYPLQTSVAWRTWGKVAM